MEKDVRVPASPFVKWVGGKRSVVQQLSERVKGVSIKHYCEPFVGGGALFFQLQPSNACISDINLPLITAYTAVRDTVGDVIRHLKRHRRNHSKEYYLKMRKRLSTESNRAKVGAIFIYLNKTCYNGLYRVNRSGGFNVPMGSYKNPLILDGDNLRNCSAVLQGVKIEQKSFVQIKPKKNTLYYLDPPYHGAYSQYDGSGFSEDDHRKLADLCAEIDRAGSYFLLSNSDTPLIRSLYSGYDIGVVRANRSVSCKAHQRAKKKELVIRNY